MTDAIAVFDLDKTFTLHTQGGVRLGVLRGVNLSVRWGDCVVLTDPSGAGKSTLLRAIYGNYLPQAGHIHVRHGDAIVDMVGAPARTVLDVRRRTLGYVSQFLRVIPRVPALDIVIEPLRALGVPRDEAVERGRAVLERLRIPERLWSLSPVTSPAASSSGSTWREASWSAIRSCCSTSRRRHWTRRAAASSSS